MLHEIFRRSLMPSFTVPLALTMGFYSALTPRAQDTQTKQEVVQSDSDHFTTTVRGTSIAVSPTSVKKNPTKKKVVKSDSDHFTTTVRGTSIADSPANLEKRCFYAFGDFLYWRADEDGLDYGQRLNEDTNHLKMREPDFHWSPGFRLGIGGQMGRFDN